MKRSRIERKEVSPPLASLGDIAFLLIIFFMLTSNFIKETAIELEPPKSAVIDKLEESRISVAISENGDVHLNGEETTKEALKQQLTAELKEKETPKGRTVMLKCDQDLTKPVYEPVIDAIAEAGGRLAAVGEQEGEK